MLQPSVPKLDPREEHYWISSPRSGLQLFLRHLSPAKGRPMGMRPVLYVHGATFPSGLSIAHRFDGYCWRDALCEASGRAVMDLLHRIPPEMKQGRHRLDAKDLGEVRDRRG